MQWTPCIVLEFSWFHAAWRNGTLLNAVDFMQHGPKHPDWVSGFHAAWLNAVDFMQHGPKHPDWMQWITCSVIECRGILALWRNGSRLYAVESMQCDECMDSRQPGKMHPDWIQWIPCSVIECSGFHAAWLNAVDSMQPGKMHPDWMQRIPCIVA